MRLVHQTPEIQLHSFQLKEEKKYFITTKTMTVVWRNEIDNFGK